MNKSRRMRQTGHVAVGNSEGMRPLGRHKYRWEDNIKVDIREIKWGVIEWIHVS
jgi:hypothetical protein